jgi:hypothetical protein
MVPRGSGGQAPPPVAANPDGGQGGGKTGRAAQTPPRETPNPGTAAK